MTTSWSDDGSYSFISTIPNEGTIYTPSMTTEHTYQTDDFDISIDDELEDPSDQASSCSTSPSPSVYDFEFAYGRRYHGYKSGRYPIPNDAQEQLREETKHALVLELTDGALFYSDIGDYPQKIIDIGTGTGTWPIDVADLYPSASVIGTDLSPIQPTWLPVNLRMFVEDCEESDWLHGYGFDLVHMRGMTSVVKGLDGLLRKVYPHIRSGGWLEIQEFLPQILYNESTMSLDDPLKVFTDFSLRGLQRSGFRTYTCEELKACLAQAGFSNIRCVVKRVPINTWPRDKKMKTVGLLMKTTISELLEALAAKPLAAMDFDPVERRALYETARDSLDDNRIHRYVHYCACYAQKLETTSDASSNLS